MMHHPTSPSSSPSLRAQVTSQNGEISCTIEETNRIRKSLGLKPLRVNSDPENQQKEPTPKSASSPTSALQNRLLRIQRARSARERTVAQRSIAEEALLEGNASDDAEDDHETELQAWVNRTRQKTQASTRPPATRRTIRQAPTSEQLVSSEIHGDRQLEAPSDVQEGAVLILADAPVLPENPDAEPEDALRDVQDGDSRPKKTDKEPRINGALYDGTDNAQFGPDVVLPSGSVSVFREGGIKVESDYRTSNKVNFKKRTKSHSRHSKRRRREVEAVETEYAQSRRHDPPVVKGRMAELRRAANVAGARGGDGESSDEDPLYTSLARARLLTKELEVKSSADKILEAINRANDEKEGDTENNDVIRDAERIVYEEMGSFLQKIPVAGASSGDESEGEAVTVVDSGKGRSIEVTKGKESGSSLVTNDDEMRDEEAKERAAVGQEDNRQPSDAQQPKITAPVPVSGMAGLDVPSKETGHQTGVAAVLQRLRAMGELKHKSEQKGRARDKRFEAEDMGRGTENEYLREIKLEYLDEFGNPVTRKEAFRMLCHKFHGKGPGQNKREKRMRKMLENLRSRSMQHDDTPLGTAAALKAETRKLGTAHIVLSGEQGLMGRQTHHHEGKDQQSGEARHVQQSK